MSVVGGVFITFAVVALCYRSVVVHRNFSLCLRLVFPEKKITKKLKQLVLHKKKLIKVKIVQKILFYSLYFSHEFYVFLIIILQNMQSIFME